MNLPSNKKLVIYGSGSFAKLMHYYFSIDSQYEVVAFTVNNSFLIGNAYCGLPLVTFEKIEDVYPATDFLMFVAIGYKNMRNRKILFENAKNKGYKLVNYISSKAIIYPNLSIGENNVVMADVNIEPFVSVSKNNIFWSKTLICHDGCIGNHNYFAPNSIVSGNVIIEDLCFFGTKCSIIDNLTIRNESFLVAGSVLLKDTKPHTRYFGNPAKPFSKTHEDRGIVISR